MHALFDIPPVSATATRRQAARRLCAWLLLVTVLCLAQAAQAGTTYRFGGPRIDNCDRDGKVYTCSKLPLAAWDDRMVIEDGYTVDVTTDVVFGYNHVLTMSGSARLTSTGNLHIGDIAPGNTQITGGSFRAGGKFTVGNQNQAITANITAGSMQLGSGSRLEITGTLVSTGRVDIASHAIIHGPVTGTDIMTNSPVVINGNVKANGGTFTLASGSKVTGNVDARTLALQSSEATITGNALVNRADLFWHGRVTGNIQCRAGATVNDCSCVNNDSGYDFNTELGPKCGPAAPPPASPIDHFLIEHDASAGTCTASRVTVTACANSSCTTRYTGGATVTLQPGGKTVQIGNAGYTESGEVSSIVAGRQKLALSSTSGTSSYACRNRGSGATGCDMDFTGGVNFKVTVPDHKAGNEVTALVQAVKANDNHTACVPGFVDVAKNVDFTCGRTLPTTGNAALTLGAQQLACNGATTQSIAASFDAQGTAKLGLSYPDVGKLALNASMDNIKGGTSFVVSPDHFVISAPSPLRAGAEFNLTVEARNANKDKTPGFDTNLLGAGSTPVEIALDCVIGDGKGTLGTDSVPPAFNAGSATFKTTFADVGRIDVKAKLAGFLGSAMSTVWSTRGNASDCSAAIGPFVPMYYEVAIDELALPNRLRNKGGKDFSYFYSGEPMSLKVTAMNAQGAVTLNYPTIYGKDDKFELSTMDKEGNPLAPALGQLQGSLDIGDFASGVAKWTGPTAPARQPRYRFAAAQTPPTPLRLRVKNTNTQKGFDVTSADAEIARPEIRSGRLRIASRFGRAGTRLALPVTAEYWTGQSWMRNYEDDFTLVPAAALGIGDAQGKQPAAGKPALARLAKGSTVLELTHAGAGWFDIVFNLGASAQYTSCSATRPATAAGAGMPWLQSRSGCIDPSGRATFGVPSPEQKRLIHVREAFR